MCCVELHATCCRKTGYQKRAESVKFIVSVIFGIEYVSLLEPPIFNEYLKATEQLPVIATEIDELVYLASRMTEIGALLLDMYNLTHMTDDEWNDWGRGDHDWYLSEYEGCEQGETTSDIDHKHE